MIKRTQANQIEIREESTEGTGNRLIGYTAKFNVPSLPLYDRNVSDEQFIEVLEPGCFTKTLRDNPNIAALYNHDTNCVLGRVDNGTLQLTEDETGLAFIVELPDTSYARDVKALVARGDIKGCSFGFVVIDDNLTPREGDYPLRTIKEVELFEISPAVCFPAYEETEVKLRAKRSGVNHTTKTPYLDHARKTFDLYFD